jgi:hypothetical protein
MFLGLRRSLTSLREARKRQHDCSLPSAILFQNRLAILKKIEMRCSDPIQHTVPSSQSDSACECKQKIKSKLLAFRCQNFYKKLLYINWPFFSHFQVISAASDIELFVLERPVYVFIIHDKARFYSIICSVLVIHCFKFFS